VASKQSVVAPPSAVPARRQRAGRLGRAPAGAVGAAEPPWPTVIAATLRLFAHRRILALRRSPGRLLAWGLAMAAVVVGAVAVLPMLGPPRRADPAAGRRLPPAAAGLAALRAAAVAQQDAARWVIGQVGRGTVVGCDSAMCPVLRAAGFPARHLRPVADPAEIPGGSVVVAAAALRGWLSSRLADGSAPVVAASFGSGSARVQVRVTAPAGAAAYADALRADWRARRSAGRQLLSNPRVVAPAAARRELAAGLVDTRLMVTLAAAAAAGPVRVAGFGDSGPHAAPGQPLRAAVLAGPGAPGSTRWGYLRSLLGLVASQRGPYRPMSARLAQRDGRPVLVITFAAPAPLGLLGPAAYENLDGL
jgi:hypothetical protein